MVDVSLELYALEEYLDIIEKQLVHLQESEKLELDAKLKKLTPDDPEWDGTHWEYYHRVEALFPRYFRGPFLVSLYAVYEAAVTEIGRLIQKKQGLAISLNDIRGSDFLERSKKYYKHILRFDLCTDNTAWRQIVMLSEIRNAIAHTNGRLEMLDEKARARIREWAKQGIGIEMASDYVIVKAGFLRKTFKCVQASLDDLVVRYKQWDSESSHA